MMMRFKETGRHVKWMVAGKHYVGQIMQISDDLHHIVNYDVFCWVRIQSTGEIVRVHQWDLSPNTCREDERKAEATNG